MLIYHAALCNTQAMRALSLIRSQLAHGDIAGHHVAQYVACSMFVDRHIMPLQIEDWIVQCSRTQYVSRDGCVVVVVPTARTSGFHLVPVLCLVWFP